MGDREPARPRFDDIDRALVLALQRDGRSSYARLAGVVGMSQAAVRSRIQRLLDSGAVQIAAVADPFAFGFTVTAMVGIWWLTPEAWVAVGLFIVIAPALFGNLLNENSGLFPEVRASDWVKKLFLRLIGMGLLAFAARFVWGIRQLF